jgi:hypothetical protein
MNCWWNVFDQLLCCAGTPEWFVDVTALVALGGLLIVAILFARECVRAFVRGLNEGRALGAAKRLKQQIHSSDSHPAPPSGDVPPTNDI